LGVSAYSQANLAKGGKLREFLTAVDAGLVPPGSHLLVESLDRLTRASISDALELFMSILRRKIIIHSLMDSAIYSQHDMDNGRGFQQLVVSLAILSRANEESATKSDRLKSAWAQKRLKADGKKMTSLAPAWVKYDAATGIFKPIPEHVAVVRRMISMAYSGLGCGVICKRLNEEEVPTFTARSGDRGWYVSYVRKVLHNRSLIGEFQPHVEPTGGRRVPDGPPISGYFPAVMTGAEFADLQALFNARRKGFGGRRGADFSNMFTGLLKCGYCKSAITYIGKGYDKRDSSKPLRYLACSRAKRGAGCCYISWRYEEFESSFLALARSVEFRNAVGAKADAGALRRQRSQITVMRSVVSDIDLQLERLVSALGGGSSQPQAIVDRIVRLEAEKVTMLERIRDAELQADSEQMRQSTTSPMLERLAALQRDLENAGGAELYDLRAEINESLRQQVREIRVYPGGVMSSLSEIDALRNDLGLKARYKAEDIEKEIARQTLPHSKKQRFFQIFTATGQMQVLHPNQPMPDLDDAMEAAGRSRF
jgi:DNA invertase Pin-like site-specific DNA recombinase